MLWYPFIAQNSKAVKRGFPVSYCIGLIRFRSMYCKAGWKHAGQKLWGTRPKPK
jgi:hypothetical protein